MTSSDFGFLKPLEEAWGGIRDEYQAIAGLSQPWRESSLHNGGWHVLGLILAGQRRKFFDLCPLTTALLQGVPGLALAGFSILKPGAVISPHVGYPSSVLRAHLPIGADGAAFLDVGGERHHWQLGHFVVFDDRVMHSAENPGSVDRAVLTLDFDKAAARSWVFGEVTANPCK